MTASPAFARRVEVGVPGDKSITHRALILASCARGTSRLRGLLASADTRSTAAVLRALGVEVPSLREDGAPIALRGVGPAGFVEPAAPLDCGNSGTTARLILGLAAGLPLRATVTGDESLLARPMRRVTDPLARMGARFEELGEPDRLPVRVEGGRLRPFRYASPRASAQVKSALLLAGVTGGVAVEVSEPVRSRDHTERMLRAMGADVRIGPRRQDPFGVRFEPPDFLEPLDLVVPGDFSSAAFFIALGLLAGRRGAGAPADPRLRVAGVGVNPTRTGLLAALGRMGGAVLQEGACEICDEPVADLLVAPAALVGTDVGPEEVPSMIDELPAFAIIAARAQGRTSIRGAEELRVKESDRLATLVANLRAIGVEAEEFDDGMTIVGGDRPLEGRVRSFGDHRIAMAFGVLAALPDHRIEIDDPGIVGVSYPGFWADLRRAAATLLS